MKKYLNTGLLIGCLVVSHNLLSAPKPSAYEKKARAALQQIVKEQIEKLKQKSNSTSSGNENNIKGFVLSTHIRSFSDIPKNIDAEIQAIREQVRFLIRRVAQSSWYTNRADESDACRV